MKNSRKVALILVALLSFFVIFSSFYIVKEADHTCSGENCPICYQISMCESATKSIAGAGAVAVAAELPAAVRSAMRTESAHQLLQSVQLYHRCGKL